MEIMRDQFPLQVVFRAASSLVTSHHPINSSEYTGCGCLTAGKLLKSLNCSIVKAGLGLATRSYVQYVPVVFQHSLSRLKHSCPRQLHAL
ncbi:uncharacterized protein YALI1_F19619g [Yarrowia lipolytica]|uniref:Uncharacterized protein n=1 Tax=Yarrowia lipolytica TaxID=4952 RepID=A0A1D8NNG8_YARLL|nr:hypothetical protein YALI1_F19619g [Yarrowia lipolytica]